MNSCSRNNFARFACIPLLLACSTTFAEDAESYALSAGDDLKGWQVISGDWRLRDGIITGESTDGTALLVSEREFSDLELEVDLSVAGDTRGSVFVRGHVLPVLPLPEGKDAGAAPQKAYGFETAVETSEETTSSQFSSDSCEQGFALSIPNALGGEWRSAKVSAVRDRGSIELGDPQGTKGSGGLQIDYVSGHIALAVSPSKQGGPGQARFRNIRVLDTGRHGDWRPLWNGKNFDGWVIWGEEEWVVEDGAIVGKSGPNKSEGYLATKETWKDFRVRGKFQMLGEGNYGLFYHSTIAYDEKHFPVISGVQGEVEPSLPGNTGCLYESYKRGWLVKPDKSIPGAYALRPGRWNEIEIESAGNRRRTWVNGIPVVDWTDPAPNLTEGAFALQLHTGGVSGIKWKDLYVLEE
ncbi:MAG: hypothetical protein AMXMBFR4_21070 [Candidatus Hydrogenedentota bacterium]